jgi:hypothetical protein
MMPPKRKAMMSEIPKLDFSQIENERKGTLELLLVVVLLGLVLNCFASVFVNQLEQWQYENYLFWTSIPLILFLLFVYFKIGLFRPAKLRAEIPIVIFFDTKANTIAVPVQIHLPLSNHTSARASIVPFPIACRLQFDKYKESGLITPSELSDIINLDKVLTSLVQYIFLDQYSVENNTSWAPKHNLSTGPFRSSYSDVLPSRKYSRTEIASLLGNKFFKMNPNGLPIAFPQKTNILSQSPNIIVLNNSLFRATVSIFCHGSSHMDSWKYARGVISSWYRELSSDYADTYAYQIVLTIEFSLKIGIGRFFGEGRKRRNSKTKVTLHDLCVWMNNVVESAYYYFMWVDEDLSILPRGEISQLINHKELTYKPQLRGASRVSFLSSPPSSDKQQD